MENSRQVSGSALFPFEREYSGVPIPSPELAVFLASWSETLFPTLVLIGLTTRFAARPLFGETLAIQMFFYPDVWQSDRSLRLAMTLIIRGRGACLLSVNVLIMCSMGTRHR